MCGTLGSWLLCFLRLLYIFKKEVQKNDAINHLLALSLWNTTKLFWQYEVKHITISCMHTCKEFSHKIHSLTAKPLYVSSMWPNITLLPPPITPLTHETVIQSLFYNAAPIYPAYVVELLLSKEMQIIAFHIFWEFHQTYITIFPKLLTFSTILILSVL